MTEGYVSKVSTSMPDNVGLELMGQDVFESQITMLFPNEWRPDRLAVCSVEACLQVWIVI